MMLHFLESVILLLLMGCMLHLMKERKDWTFGLKTDRLDGSQGLETTVGRLGIHDIVDRSGQTSRMQGSAFYDIKHRTIQWQGKPVPISFGLPERYPLLDHHYLPLLLTSAFLILRMVELGQPALFGMLMLYVIVMNGLKADHMALADCIFVILLSFHIQASSHPYLGVIGYLASSILIRIVIQVTRRAEWHQWLRRIAALGILLLIGMNILLASKINGAYNWVTIGSVQFQPSEIVKILYLFILVVPAGHHLGERGEQILILSMTLIGFLYAYLIRDIGLLVQLGALFMVAVLVQNHALLLSITLILLALLVLKLLPQLSAEVAERLSGWLGGSLLSSLTAGGSFLDASNYGYQSVHAIVAFFVNGGLFGHPKLDILQNITASHSDLVVAWLGQMNGFILMMEVLGLEVLLLFHVLQKFKEERRQNQVFSLLGCLGIMVAVFLNVGGTFSIIPLTGVVNPALSNGISASISYGAMFGLAAYSDLVITT